MKISLNWVFDHIKGGLQKVDIAQLVDRFIKTTAEIEGWQKVTCNTDVLTLASVVSVGADGIVVHSPELKKEFVVPLRADAVVGSWYIMQICSRSYPSTGSGRTEGKGLSSAHPECFCPQKCIEGSGRADELDWATTVVFGGKKDMLLPRVSVDEALRAGGWKKTIEREDYIIDVDNKSINHRPDLWGHRGIAREIAAIFDLQLRPIDEFVVQKKTVDYATHAPEKMGNYAVTIEATDVCKRFTSVYIEGLQSQPSSIAMIVRLSRLDSRAIDLLVDITNTVMLDLGQPMHAFDAHTIAKKNLIVRRAHRQEKLLLLDGETVTLTPEDIVIADGNGAISLAGIMGGATTGISAKTTAVVLESANFDATTVRRSAARYKKRSEASTRFEKSLDPNHISDALTRFLFLLNAAGVSYKAADEIVSVGMLLPEKTITVAHLFIQARLGMEIEPQRVVSILEKLFFGVTTGTEKNDTIYTITVPSFRATKDVKIPEDIVEEVGRFIGYDDIPRVMPLLALSPTDLHKTHCIRAMKRFLSYGAMMRELYGYSFFDESFLHKLAWAPIDYVAIKNPISENYTRLVTTLQPHLLKAVGENSIQHPALRFYEWGRVWHMQQEKIVEQKSLSGIFFDQEKHFDFYAGKALLTRLFEQMHMVVTWKSNSTNEHVFPWLVQHQTAQLMHNNTVIGVAGMVDDAIVQSLSPAGGSAFMFELNGDYLIEYKRPVTRCAPLSKYPSVLRDVSMLLPLSVTVDSIAATIKGVDTRIVSAVLIDFFTKPEWENQKALTFHVEIQDAAKTLEHDEVEALWNKVIAQLVVLGAVIR